MLLLWSILIYGKQLHFMAQGVLSYRMFSGKWWNFFHTTTIKLPSNLVYVKEHTYLWTTNIYQIASNFPKQTFFNAASNFRYSWKYFYFLILLRYIAIHQSCSSYVIQNCNESSLYHVNFYFHYTSIFECNQIEMWVITKYSNSTNHPSNVTER